MSIVFKRILQNIFRHQNFNFMSSVRNKMPYTLSIKMKYQTRVAGVPCRCTNYKPTESADWPWSNVVCKLLAFSDVTRPGLAGREAGAASCKTTRWTRNIELDSNVTIVTWGLLSSRSCPLRYNVQIRAMSGVFFYIKVNVQNAREISSRNQISFLAFTFKKCTI